ncbi:MAG: hypothetical protein FWC89_09125 [Defluviitaleaceae bacterium]|nr:hypothetical protein [Defluviitaleaceae bacterium]
MKRRNIGKILAFLLVFIFTASNLSVFANSAPPPPPPPPVPRTYNVGEPNPHSRSTNNSFDGALPASPEEIAYWNAFWRTHTIEDVLRMQGFTDTQIAATFTPTFVPFNQWIMVSRFRYVGQETGITCGAAVARMSLYTINGWAPNEFTVLNGFPRLTMYPEGGTTTRSLQSYLAEMTRVWYNRIYDADQVVLTKALEASIRMHNRPSILQVYPQRSHGFPYDLNNRHFVATYGVSHAQARTWFAIADPWGGYNNNRAWELFTLDAENLHSAYIQNGGILW